MNHVNACMRAALAAILLFLLWPGAQGIPSSPAGVHAQQPEQPYAQGQLIVRFRRDVPAMMIASALWSARLQTVAVNEALDLELVSVEPGREEELITELRSNPLVLYVGPNYLAHIAGEPNDPAWWRQWNMKQIRASEAWDVTTGNDWIIAILDTGVDLSHPDLAPKLVKGYDFVNQDDSPQDDHGHGTHVAGIAAAAGNNGIGIAGMSWGARIMPLKVLDAQGDGTYFDIIQAIQYAADHGARIINLSLGGSSPDPNLLAAVTYARGRGCLVVAAAGNQGAALLYPAAYAETFAVAATTDRQQRASYSNFGPGVDIAAPGGTSSVGIYSLAPGGGYASLYGTSMATPHVSGLAALVWSMAPALTADQVVRVIEITASKVGSAAYDASGWNEQLGYGQINAAAALQYLAGSPSPTPTRTRTPAATPTPTVTPTPVVRTQEIPLVAGWNLISLNVRPADARIESLTAGLRPALELALGFQCSSGGLSYYPDLPASLSTLRTLEPGRGYWLKMKEARLWRVTGEPLDPGAPLALCSGWNLAGYLPARAMPLPQALASLGDAFETVLGYRNGQALSYYTALPPYLNTLQMMEPGYGYWIFASRPAILVYPNE